MAMRVEQKESKVLLVGEKDIWIPVNRRISRILGKTAAEVLQQIHYWITTNSGAIINGRRWVYNTYKEWSNQLGIGQSTLRAIIRFLEKAGILLSGNFNKKKSDRTKWYTIAYDVLKEAVGFDPEETPSSPQNKPVDNSSTWTAENQHIIYRTKITSENTGLNNARARETIQPLVEEYQQPVESVSTDVESTSPALPTPTSQARQELEPALNPTLEAPTEAKTACEVVKAETFTDPKASIADRASQTVQELINAKLDKPLEINKKRFEGAINKTLGKFFGVGEAGLERWRDFCQKVSDNDFLMGKKAMKSGDFFGLSIGTLFSEKIIQASWDMSWVFCVYSPKNPTPDTINGDEAVHSANVEQPTLSLEEVLTTARDPVDKKIKTKLYQVLGAVTYWTWFHVTGFVARGLGDWGVPTFDVKNGFAREHILTHYSEQLQNAFVCAMGDE